MLPAVELAVNIFIFRTGLYFYKELAYAVIANFSFKIFKA